MDRSDADCESKGGDKTSSVSPDLSSGDFSSGKGIRGDLINCLRGCCMGAADAVPGVSGGTIALIMGHYQRLIAAISHFDVSLLGMLRKRQVASAYKHVDGRFLTMLAVGIVMGVVTFLRLMGWLLDNRLPETLSVFLGLLLASVWIVQAHVDRWTVGRILWALGGVVAAVLISRLPAGEGNGSLLFLFGTAAIAICAMILPGISGALVLVMFGSYHMVTGLIKDFLKLNITMDGFLQLVAFGSGCVFGLLAFSRILNWLLQHFRSTTMAVLMGLMVGSIVKLWPLQRPTEDTASLDLKNRVMEYVWPSQWNSSDWNGSTWPLLLLTVGSFALVLAIEWYGKRRAGQLTAR
jgi:putative membrane protein